MVDLMSNSLTIYHTKYAFAATMRMFGFYLALREHSSLSTEFSSFIEQVTCDTTSKCTTRECSTCVDLIDDFAPQSSSVTLQYSQWKSIDSRIEKAVMTDTVDAVYNELKKQLTTFLLHTFVKRNQAALFDSMKNSCDDKSIVLQVDFSENATTAVQKEVQAAHWHHAQATILHLLNSFDQTFKLNSLPSVRLINNLHFWMPNRMGWWQSPNHTEFTVFKWMRSK